MHQHRVSSLETRTMRPLISVVIPVRDGARFIIEAIASVRAQDYSPLEIIVVDDASSDDTVRVVGALDGVRLIRREHGGPAAARNTGLAHAEGEWITFLDADDRWPSGSLGARVECLLQEPHADVVIGLTQRATEAVPDAQAGAEHPVLATQLGCGLFTRAAFNRVGTFDESLHYSEDHDWFLRARELGLRIRVLPLTTLLYRVHTGGMTRAVDRPRDLQLLHVLKRSLDRRRTTGAGVAPPLPAFGELDP